MGLKLDRIHQIAIFSSDLDRSIEFYRDVLGARFMAKFDPPGLAFFQFGETRLMLEENARRGTIYFRVADIHEAYATLVAKGIAFDEEPKMLFREDEGTFGPVGMEEWMAFLRDPDGSVIALVSQVRPKN